MKRLLLNFLILCSVCFHAGHSLSQDMSKQDFISAVQEGSLNLIRDQLEFIRTHDLNSEESWTVALQEALEISVSSGFGKMTTALIETAQFDTFILGKALVIAAKKGHKKIAEILIEAGALIDFQHTLASSYEVYYFKSDKIKTPLMEAALRGRDSVVTLLLEQGADPTLTSEGMTAYDLAVKYKQPKTAKIENLNPAEYGMYNKAKAAFFSLPWTPILIATGIIVATIYVRSYLNSPVDDCAICLDPLSKDTLQLPCQHTFHKECIRGLFSSSWPQTLTKYFESDDGLQGFQLIDKRVASSISDKKLFFSVLGECFSTIFAENFARWMNEDSESNTLSNIANTFSISLEDRFLREVDPTFLMNFLAGIQQGIIAPMGEGAVMLTFEFARLFPELGIQFAIVFSKELQNQGAEVLKNSLKTVFTSHFLGIFQCPLCRAALTHRASRSI